MRDAEYDYGLAPGERFEPDEDADEPSDSSRPHVMTALGPIDPGALGFTLPHEHVICKPPDAETDLALNDVANAVAELDGYAMAGGRAIVDLTTADYGRAIGDMLWVAQRVPVHIVLATGHHGHRCSAQDLGDRTTEEIAQSMVQELVEGIDGTGVRAGVIVAGTSQSEITALDERVAQAAAVAHRATGAPVLLDPASGSCSATTGLIAILLDEGIDPERLIIGNVGVTMDEAHLVRLLETGVFVCFDQWTRADAGPEKNRSAMVKRLVDKGYGEQILISGSLSRRSEWLSYGGGPGFVHFIDRVSLTLMDAGMDALAVRQIFVQNPARALTIAHPGTDA